MISFPRSSFCCFLIFSLSCCTANHSPTKADSQNQSPVITLYQHAHCQGPTDKSFTQLSSVSEIKKYRAKVFSLSNNNNDLTTSPAVPKNHAIIALSMGTQPNTGYSIELANNYIHRSDQNDDSQAELEINWITPASNKSYGQVLTSPCLIVAVPTFGSLRIIDNSSGKLVESLILNKPTNSPESKP